MPNLVSSLLGAFLFVSVAPIDEEGALSRGEERAQEPLIINSTQEAPVVDGRLDEWPTDFEYHIEKIDQIWERTERHVRWLGPGDASLHVNLKFDEFNLYLAGRLLDDSIVIDDTIWWNGDAIEVFIDADRIGDQGTTTYSQDDFQVFLMPWSPSRPWGVGKRDGGFAVSHGGFDGVQVASVAHEGGFVFEAAIPLANFRGLEESRGEIAFNIAYNDVDSDEIESFTPTYITLNGKGKLFTDPTAFIPTTLSGFRSHPPSPSRFFLRLWQGCVALILLAAFLGIGLYARTFHDFVEDRFPRWRKIGLAIILVLVVLVVGGPLLLVYWLERDADRSLEEGVSVVDEVTRVLHDEGFVATWPGLTDPRTQIDFLGGLVVEPRSRYDYETIESPTDKERAFRQSVAGVPFHLQRWGLEDDRRWILPLAKPLVCTEVHLALETQFSENWRRSRGAPLRATAGVRVTLHHKSGRRVQTHLSVRDSGSMPRGFSAPEFIWVDEQPIEIFRIAVDRVDDDPLERVSIEVLEPEVDGSLWGMSLVTEKGPHVVRHGKIAPNGVPSGSLSVDEGFQLRGGQRCRFPVSGSPDNVWLFYAMEQDSLWAKRLDGEEGLRGTFWYRDDPDPHDISLRVGQHIDTSDRYFSELGQELASDLAFTWKLPVEMVRLDPLPGRKLEFIELYCPNSILSMRIVSLVCGRKVTVGLNSEQEVVDFDESGESFFLSRPYQERLNGLRFMIIENGVVQATNFEADLDRRLVGVYLRDKGEKNTQSHGDREYVFADRELSWGGRTLTLRVLREIRGRESVVWTQKRLGAGTAILCIPFGVLFLLDRVRRLSRLRLKFTTLLVIASIVPIVILSLLMIRMLESERNRALEARASRLLRDVQASVDRHRSAAGDLAFRILALPWIPGLCDEASTLDEEKRLQYERSLETLGRGLGGRSQVAIRVDIDRSEDSHSLFSRAQNSVDIRPDFGRRGLIYNWGYLVYAATASRDLGESRRIRVTVNGVLNREILSTVGFRQGESAALFSIDRRYHQGQLPGGILLSDTEFGTDPPHRAGMLDVLSALRMGPGVHLRERTDGGLEAFDFLRDRLGQPVALFGVKVSEDRPGVNLGIGVVEVEWLSLMLGAMMLSVSLVLGGFLSDDISTPIKRLARAAMAISKGRAFPEKIETIHDDEIGSLTSAYNKMSDELARRRDEQERLRRVQLELSRTIEYEDQLRVIQRTLGRELRPLSLKLLLYDRDRDRLVDRDLNSGTDRGFFTREKAPSLFEYLGSSDIKVFKPLEFIEGSWTAKEQAFLKSNGSCCFVPLGVRGAEAGMGVAWFDPGVEPLEGLSLNHLASLRELLAAAMRHARLYHLAIEDPTTGLLVPTYLLSRLGEELDRSASDGREVTLFKLGIESFDAMMNSEGASFATNLEVVIARRLRAACRSMDVISRESPGIFTVLMPEGGRERLESLWDVLTRDLPTYRGAHTKPSPVLLTGASVTYPEDGQSREFLLRTLEKKWKEAVKSDTPPPALSEARTFMHELRDRFPELVFRSQRMEEVLDQARRVAVSKATVMLLGETGAGKEVIARIIHDLSDRASGPFVALNCSALPETLLESELFGHEKGAFTGADRTHRGHFEEAIGGTLFLDEVGEITVATQAKLLRVLQEHHIQRLGGGKPIEVDVRILTATNRNLEEMVNTGSFREDLYYRLKVVTITIPPLRERLDDLPHLALSFVQRQCREAKLPQKSLEPACLDRLYHHEWPGNVRELRNVIQRAVLLTEGDSIGPSNIDLDDSKPRSQPIQSEISPALAELNDRQRLFLELLRERGTVTNRDYFEAVGVSRRTGLRDIALLVDRGLILKQGHRRAAIYRLVQ